MLIIVLSMENPEAVIEHEAEKSLVLSILLYGCETWPLTEWTKKKLRGVEMKC